MAGPSDLNVSQKLFSTDCPLVTQKFFDLLAICVPVSIVAGRIG